ncbi:MAG: hypothetical protein WAV76_06200 [Bacteroidota bacterium]|jgi:hypothetical protein
MKIESLALMFVFAVIIFGCRTEPTDGGNPDGGPNCQFGYNVPYAAHVLLTLENSYNTRVATLVDADQTPGSYVINFNAGLYPSGVYFIVLDIKGSNNQDSSITRNTTIFRP